MIDNIYNTVRVISNNEMRGNVTPTEFNTALYNAMLERYEELFYELNRLINRSNRGLTGKGYADLPSFVRERISFYNVNGVTVSQVGGTYAMPDDLKYLNAVFLDGVQVEPAKSATVFNLATTLPDIAPTALCPIYLRTGNNIQISPDDTTGDITISYLRQMLPPKWTYTLINGTELFNPSASDFQDVDMHPGEQEALIRRTLHKLGINLKEPDLAGYMKNDEVTRVQQENAT